MANRDLVAIGASAGGVEALLSLAKALPADFPAAILITIHLSPRHRSSLDELLTRAGPLKASFAADGEPIRRGHIYLASPGQHMLADGDRLSLGNGPRENNVRPAIDPMLRSAAACCGHRTIGVILTGTQGDGASGLLAVRECGGVVVVQDPRDAAFPEMPLRALDLMKPDHVVPLSKLPKLLESLVHEPVGKPVPTPEEIKFELEIARDGRSGMAEMDRIGQRSTLTCPDCGGVMWEIDDGGEEPRYRCHQGHAYSGDTMSVAVDEHLRRALGSAVRALEERIALMRKLHRQAHERQNRATASNWADRAEELEREADVIRDSIRRIDSAVAQAAE